ncbi:MAG: DNA polymerase II large subunit [Halobacteriota archaeon]|nr:DNA polymerase II large subunit [Halobacteriota archaeon]
MEGYFRHLEGDLQRAISIAKEARKRGSDPSPYPEIPIAKDLADRVESLVEIKVAKRIRELELEVKREEAALRIGLDFAEGRFSEGKTKIQVIEDAIRTAVAMLTEGVVAAPIEGIAKVEEGKNDDGSSYVKIFYAGPIRSAGGTAQALSVLVADYVRRALGFSSYKPRADEIERYIEEVAIYRRVANLQYTPTNDEIRLIVKNCPICIDGEPTEEVEVEGYRDLERVETNRVRGGVSLIIAEGIALKAPKLKKYVNQLKLNGWDWLDDLHKDVKIEEDDSKISPKEQFLKDLIAGRPVFSHPSAKGGFRLRYGRARNSGIAAAGINPATMMLLDDFISPGTQVKLERPGKAASMVPVDSIDGPTVRLKNGDVVRIDTVEGANKLREEVERIIDVGEILIGYGEFLENNHILVPGSYCIDWWKQELMTKAPEGFDYPGKVTAQVALEYSNKWGVPIHPEYTYTWHDISMDEFRRLSEFTSENGRFEGVVLSFPMDSSIKDILEKLLVLHHIDGERIIIAEGHILAICLGLDLNLRKSWEDLDFESPLDAVQKLSGLKVMVKAPTRIGGRMGRPEKSKRREMKPAPHLLFPIGDSGGRSRLLNDATKKYGEIEVEMGMRYCLSCREEMFECRCECGEFTVPIYKCPSCNIVSEGTCPRCGKQTTSIVKQMIDIRSLHSKALRNLKETNTNVKAVQGMISKNKTAEPIEKGILRAKHGVFVFKDGTIRYDMTDLPLTHFRPDEIGISAEKARELGYKKDIYGDEISRCDQLIELKVQDVIISFDAGDYLLNCSKFIDDLLVKYYHLEPYFNAATRDDMVGELIIGLAPHTSAGVLGRILGFTKTSTSYAHPFFHTAKRRNCDGDEDCVMLLMDGLLNFSRSYLPERRGGKMDAPLVLTSRIHPKEIDSEAHNIDVMGSYPLEFYEATLEYKRPKDIEDCMDLVSGRLGTPLQYCDFSFTHDTRNINDGPRNSAYKTLGSMIEKMEAQLELARKLRSVDESDVAERVIKSHFIPDLMGNMRAFSRQQVRCVKCNKKYRRVPLSGVCKCGGKLILTVHESSVRKYMEVSLKIAEEFGVSCYVKQRLELLNLEINSLFGSDVSKQMDLSDFM